MQGRTVTWQSSSNKSKLIKLAKLIRRYQELIDKNEKTRALIKQRDDVARNKMMKVLNVSQSYG